MNIANVLLKEYELRVSYLVAHFHGRWTRFNFFVTIESALMSALVSGQLLFGSKDIAADELSHVRAGLASVGLVLSLMWYVFGAEDRFLVERYRNQVKEAAMKIKALVPNARYHGYVGQTEYRDHQDDPRLIEYNDPSSWRIEPISTTRLGALFPLYIFLLWLSLVTCFPELQIVARTQERTRRGALR